MCKLIKISKVTTSSILEQADNLLVQIELEAHIGQCSDRSREFV